MKHSPRNRSAMERTFSKVIEAPEQRSSFHRPSDWKGTFDCDHVIPTYLTEVIPGDTIDLKMSAIMRLATPLHPIMDNLKIKYEAFFVPI